MIIRPNPINCLLPKIALYYIYIYIYIYCFVLLFYSYFWLTLCTMTSSLNSFRIRIKQFKTNVYFMYPQKKRIFQLSEQSLCLKHTFFPILSFTHAFSLSISLSVHSFLYLSLSLFFSINSKSIGVNTPQ